MTTVQIQVETGPAIRQDCLACHGETDKHAVQAFCYIDGHDVAAGAICECCLQQPDLVRAGLPVLGTIPTCASLARARALFDFEEEVYLETGVWPGLEAPGTTRP